MEICRFMAMNGGARRRAWSALGLGIVIILVAGLQALPSSVAYIERQGNWVRTARARMRGSALVEGADLVRQRQGNDCGAACLKMILAASGVERSLGELTREVNTGASGTSLLDLRLAAARMGIPARSWKLGEADLFSAPLPAIAFIDGDHFVVVRRRLGPGLLEVDDPALGRLQWPIRSFRRVWRGESLIFDALWSPP